MTASNRDGQARTALRGGDVIGANTETGRPWSGPGQLNVRDVSLFAEVVGHGYPVVFMHGGPAGSTASSRQTPGGRARKQPVPSFTVIEDLARSVRVRHQFG